MNQLIEDYTTFQKSVFESVEILLRELMNDNIVIYGIPWWQWIVGGAFLATIGYIILQKVTR